MYYLNVISDGTIILVYQKQAKLADCGEVMVEIEMLMDRQGTSYTDVLISLELSSKIICDLSCDSLIVTMFTPRVG